MPTITQLNPALHMETPKGSGWAHFLIDYGQEGALMWVVFMDADGACWTVPNFEVRMTWNWSMGRRKPQDRAPGEVDRETAQRPPQPFRPTLAHPVDGV